MPAPGFHVTVLALSALAACSPAAAPPDGPEHEPFSIAVFSGNGQSAIVATPVRLDPTVEVLDAEGRPLMGVTVTFRVVSGNGWIESTSDATDQDGRASARWYLGPLATTPQLLEARAAGVATQFAATATHPIAGQTTFGVDSFIEWIAGDLPIVLSAPHGGTLAPVAIPDRTNGTTTRDLNTDELAREISDAFHVRFGRRPHLVICRLSRRKLDANREVDEAAAGNAIAISAWREYHGFLEGAVAEARRTPGIGFYLDIHGHGHDLQRIELGYLLSAATLALSDVVLNADPSGYGSSVWPFALHSDRSLSSVIRGPVSLGAWLERGGFPSVPSPANPSPGTTPYFEGGYSTERHGTSSDQLFAGVQVELNLDGIRDTPANRQAFAASLVTAVDGFLRDHLVQLAARRP